MKILRFGVILLLFHVMNCVDDDKIVIKALEHISPLEFYNIRQIAHSAGVDFNQIIDGNLDLLVVISQKNNKTRQLVIGDQGNGQIFYISDDRGFIVDQIDSELIAYVEQACKASGARSIHCLHDLRTQCLRNLPGFFIKPSRRTGSRLVKKFEK